MDFLKDLNPQQREAVAHLNGPLLILAGAGSGKTRVITHRIGHLIRNHSLYPNEILAVTFTNKAAGEMRDRVAALLGESDPNRLPRLSTFHSFCVRLLRRDGDHLAALRPGFTRNFNIYDEDDQLSLVKQVYRSLGLDEKFLQHRAARSRISQAKNCHEAPQDLYKNAGDPRMSRLAVIYERYEDALRQANAVDFDDLLLETVRLLRSDDALRDKYNRWIRYLMIDEFQDTNRSQYDLMRLLTVRQQNVCVVGDEDQSIYSWRGADINNILDFENDYPDAKVIRLEQNYRSTRNILAAAGAVVAKNTMRKGKRLWADSPAGPLVGIYEALDSENEALFIADSIDRLLHEDPASRAAVLYRTNSQSRQLEEALRRYGRPYVVVGGFSFYQRAEVKDLLAYLKVAACPQDSISLLRIVNTPARGIGRTTMEQVERFALEQATSVWGALGAMLEQKRLPARAEASLSAFRKLIDELSAAAVELPVDEVLKLAIERTGYRTMLESDTSPESQSRLENLSELVNAATEAAERGEDITEFLDHAALVSDSDQLDEQAKICLLTLHNAKGLEFPIVFVAGMEDGLFPHSRSLNSLDQMEEERRLCYVGMTRARQRLTLSWARFRRKFGGGPSEPTIPSRFLSEVPRELVEPLGVAQPAIPQVDLYAERYEVREAVRRNTYTGKTYNSLENIAQFFQERGVRSPAVAGQQPSTQPVAAAPAAHPPAVRLGTAAKKRRTLVGKTFRHAKYGQGTVLRQEGEGEDAKLTVSFPGYGLKKLIAKFTGLRIEE
jgi:DNA helicase-2/ATP-dependent DNA helicase PcrA